MVILNDKVKSNISIALHETFEKNAKLFPKKTAVRCNEYTISYENLSRQADKVACFLRAHTKTNNALVAVCLERGINAIVAILGIHKAGFAYLAIDPNYPDKHTQCILEDAEAELVITEPQFKKRLSGVFFESGIFNMDTIFSSEIQNDYEIKNIKISTNELAYIVYTSGSTGKPKGIKVLHASLCNIIREMIDCFEVSFYDVTLMVTSLVFDINLADIYIPLVSGATLIIANEQQRKSGDALRKIIHDTYVSFMQATPGTWQLLLDTNWEGSDTLTALTGGEAISLNLAQKLLKKVKRLWNVYGPAEATVWATYAEISRDTKVISIGKPFQGVQVFILNDSQRLSQDANVTGELCISGVGLAEGYVNRKILTCERFVYLKDINGESILVYKTGDTAYFSEQHELIYVGRQDQQFKFRGFRVEAGEIEAQLLKIPCVKQCVVIATPIISEQNDLIAVIVSDNSTFRVTTEYIHNHLMCMLPQHMIPNIVQQVKSLPLNINGKIDKKTIEYNLKRYQHAQKIMLPRNEIEKKMFNIWKNALNNSYSSIDIRSNFFSLGGHSIIASNIVSRVNNEFNKEINIEFLYEAPTIESLSQKISDLPDHEENLFDSAIINQNENMEYPLSIEQLNILIADRKQIKKSTYNLSFILKINGEVNLKKLEAAVQKVIGKHSLLRTFFVKKDDSYVQVLKGSTNNFGIKIKNIKCEFKKEWKKIKENLTKKINLETWPLFNITCVETQKNKTLIFCFHHLIFDGLSLVNFLKDISFFYNEREVVCESKTPQYYHYVTWQQCKITTQKNIDFWEKKLDNFHYLKLPYDKKRNLSLEKKTNYLQIKINRALAKKIRDFSEGYKVTQYSIFLSILNLVLFRYCGQSDIAIGCPSSITTFPCFEKIIGPVGNMLILRTKLKDTEKYVDYVKSQMQIINHAIAHENIPFDKLLEIANLPRFQYKHPLTPLALIQLPDNYGQGLIKNIETTFKMSYFGISNFDFSIFFYGENDYVQLHAEYDSSLFKREFISDFLEKMTDFMEVCIMKPNENIQSIIQTSLKQQILKGNLTSIPELATLHDIFTSQSKKTPDTPAVKFLDEMITYQQLEKISNSIMNFFLSNNMSGELVLVCVERSIDAIVLLLSLLKSGCVYVPIDIHNPADRLIDIIKHSEAKFIIVENHHTKQFNMVNEKLSITILSLSNIKNLSKNLLNKKHSFKVTQNNIAYAMHTTGTTGYPKAVLVNHHTLINLIFFQTNQYKNRKHKNVSQFAALSFDVSLQEIFYALINGLTLHIFPDCKKQDINSLIEFANDKKIDLLTLPTSVLSIFLDNILQKNKRLDHLSDIIVSGEKLHICQNVKCFFTIYRNITLTNQYGPTETHVVTCYKLPKDISKWEDFPPIGTPIDNVDLYVLDDHYQQVPFGVTGELYVSSRFLSSGYYNLPKATEKSFITIPVLSKNKLYRTGDRVKMISGHKLLYIDRVDNQVKISGKRIELDEIQYYILEYPGVHECFVMLEPDSNNYLIAYIVKIPSNLDLTQESLILYLSRKLPEYMIPRKIIFLPVFPLNNHGKIDKKALANINKEYKFYLNERKSDWNKDEMAIHATICSILNLDQIALQQNLFATGVNSLIAMKIILRLEKVFSCELPFNLIDEYPTISSLANALKTYRLHSLEVL